MLGKRFGLLVVVDRINRHTNGYAKYLCLCDCGNTAVFDIRSLRKGTVTSCGNCRPNTTKHYRDLHGYTKGRLTIIEKLPQRDYKGSIMWRCLCQCGKECTYSADTLLHSRVVSYGCYRRDTLPKVMWQSLQKTDTDQAQPRRKARSDNRTGTVGVCQLKNGRYCAYISLHGKRHHLGTFKTLDEAVAARKQGEAMHLGTMHSLG